MPEERLADVLGGLRGVVRTARQLVGLPVEAVRSLVLVLTSACNLRCRYCSQARDGTARMPEATLQRSLDVLLAYPGRRPRVEFYGGEPLLAFDLVQWAVAYLDARSPAGVGPELSLTTNGLLMTDEVAGFLERHRVATQLSFDGVTAAQDARAPGSFAVLDALLRRLPREHPTLFHELLGVRLTLTSENLPFLSASIRYFLARGVPTISVTPLITPEPEWRDDTVRRLEVEIAAAFRASLAHFRRTGTIPVDFARPRDGLACLQSDDWPLCGFGRSALLVVDTDGAVLPCAGAVGLRGSEREGAAERLFGPLPSGTVFDPDLDERLEAREARLRTAEVLTHRAAKHSSFASCAECPARSECRTCPLATALLPGNADPHRVADQACAFTQACAEARRRFAAAFAGRRSSSRTEEALGAQARTRRRASGSGP